MSKARDFLRALDRSTRYGLPLRFYIIFGGRYWLVPYTTYLTMLRHCAAGEILSEHALRPPHKPVSPEYMQRERQSVLAKLAGVDHIRNFDRVTPEEAAAFLAQSHSLGDGVI